MHGKKLTGEIVSQLHMHVMMKKNLATVKELNGCLMSSLFHDDQRLSRTTIASDGC
jgi:hypothetical protein